MDDLTFFVASHHLRVRLQRLALHPDLWRFGMTPKLAGLAQAMGVFKNDIEAQSEKLLARVESAASRSKSAFAKAHGVMDEAARGLEDVETFIASLEGSNGGPTLPGSAASQAAPQAASQPGAAIEGETTQQLTVNGVQA